MFTDSNSTNRFSKMVQFIILSMFILFPDLLFSQKPIFGELDQGSMPYCLIELSPQIKTAGWIVNAKVPYTVWAAPKVKNQQYYNADWKSFGPFTLEGKSRYIFNLGSGELSENTEITGTTTILSPALASLHVQNLGFTSVWIIVNPLPPGCGENLGESGNTEDPNSQVPGSGNISGNYTFNANNYKGKLEINENFTGGRVFFDISGKWENVENMSYNSKTGEIYFARPWGGNPTFQQYTGKISGSKITGTFTDNNYPGQKFNWEAEK